MATVRFIEPCATHQSATGGMLTKIFGDIPFRVVLNASVTGVGTSQSSALAKDESSCGWRYDNDASAYNGLWLDSGRGLERTEPPAE